MNAPPRVTVVVPTYNRSRRLCETLDSVLAQSFSDLDLIVIDDGSTDDTPRILEEYAARDARVRVFLESNQGAAAARTRGLSEARGEYLAFLDHDDVWLPEKLRLQVQALDADPEAGWVYGRCAMMTDDGQELGEFAQLYGYPHWDGWIHRRLLLHQNFIATYSLPLFRRSVLASAGPPWPGAGISDDWDLFLRVAAAAPIAFIDEVLLRYNAGNPDSQSRSNLRRAYECEAAVMRRHAASVRRLGPMERLALRARLGRRWGFWLKELAVQEHRRGAWGEAWHWYVQAARLNPRLLLSVTFLKDAAAAHPLRHRREAHP